MAPRKPIQRTYGRTNIKSFEAFNKLIAKNITKRRLKKIQIPELPSRFVDSLLNETSLNITTNNTFDRLLKGPVLNKVKLKSVSRSKLFINSTIHSPIITRSRSRSNFTVSQSISNHDVLRDYSSISRLKEPTTSQDRIDSSLYVERQNATAKLLRSDAINFQTSCLDNTTNNVSAVFSKSLRERVGMLHCSTPLHNKKTRIINQPLSPIRSELKKVIEQSLEEIENWNAGDSLKTEIRNRKRSLDSIDCLVGFNENEIQTGAAQSAASSSLVGSFSRQIHSELVSPRQCATYPLNQFEEFAASQLYKSSICDDNVAKKFPTNFVTHRKRRQTSERVLKHASPKDCIVKLTKVPQEIFDESGSINLRTLFEQDLIVDLSKDKSTFNVSKELIINLTNHKYTKDDSLPEGVLNITRILKRQLVVNLTRHEDLGQSGISETETSNSLVDSIMSDHSYCKIDSVEPEITKPKERCNVRFLPNLINITERSLEPSIVVVSDDEEDDVFKKRMQFSGNLPRNSVTLRSGKSWRRSLVEYRRESCLFRKSSRIDVTSRQSIRIVPVSDSINNRTSVLEKFAQHNQRETELKNDQTLADRLGKSIILPPATRVVSARSVVLQKCGLTKPLRFSQCYSSSILSDCKKIGEGVYGEVFMYKHKSQTTVMKVIPVEGTLIINNDRQKKFEEILSEVVITTALSNLRTESVNKTSAFAEVQNVRCVTGRYPNHLLELWNYYDDEKGSENDSPSVFDDNQLYVVFDLANAGKDLEAYAFTNAQQALAVFEQVALALAVAEEELKFEHRDLHWGNVLITDVPRTKKTLFCLNGKKYQVSTKGALSTIIDFTLSRMECDGVIMYNDLSTDEDLYSSHGDYQFDIYRLMRERNNNDWQKFEPYSNVLWLHYILDKAIDQRNGLRYKNINTKIHKEHLLKLHKLKDRILGFNSVKEFVLDYF